MNALRFGDPSNPFNESPRDADALEDLDASPLRMIASE
jgi:hypothetical protein